MQQPLARVLGGRLWRGLVGAMAALGLTAVFGVLVDSGWPLGEAALGAIAAGSLVWLAGILVQQRVRGRDSHDDGTA